MNRPLSKILFKSKQKTIKTEFPEDLDEEF